MVHPLFDTPLPTETGCAPFRNIPAPNSGPRPMPGEHTREICQKLLGLDADEIDRLIADGVLFTCDRTRPRSRSSNSDHRSPERRCSSATARSTSATSDPAIEPIDLMEAAARAAADPRVLEAVDSVRIVNLLSWRYRDPGLLLAHASGPRRSDAATRGSAATSRSHWSTRRASTSSAGRADIVLIAGAETWRTRTKVRAGRGTLDWTKQDESVPLAGRRRRAVAMAGPAEIKNQPGPAGVRLPAVRAGAADRRGGVVRRTPPPHR